MIMLEDDSQMLDQILSTYENSELNDDCYELDKKYFEFFDNDILIDLTYHPPIRNDHPLISNPKLIKEFQVNNALHLAVVYQRE